MLPFLEVQGLKIVIDCPQPGSSLATNGFLSVSRWLKWVMTQWWSSSGAMRESCHGWL